MMRILHVTECFEGGVGKAIENRASALPQAEHFLLYLGRDTPNKRLYTETELLPNAIIRRFTVIRRAVSKWNIDVVHAHSSWAGFYTRAQPIKVPIVYEPHCFKFDDPSLSRLQRLVFTAGEKVLARNTSVFGTLSAHEEELVHRLRRNASTCSIPNVPSLPVRSRHRTQVENQANAKFLVMVGRVAKQKDPKYFIQVVEALHALGSDLQPIWVGAGNSKLEAQLEEQGIQVTGWLQSKDLVQILDRSVYVHTASYEGFPVSVLDAAARACPSVIRRISAFEGTNLQLVDSPMEAATRIQEVVSDLGAYHRSLMANRVLLQTHNEQNIRSALREMYGKAQG